jgi:hypothetical protein
MNVQRSRRNKLVREWRQIEKATDGIERWPMWPKIVQVNGSDIYIVAGNNSTPKT